MAALRAAAGPRRPRVTQGPRVSRPSPSSVQRGMDGAGLERYDGWAGAGCARRAACGGCGQDETRRGSGAWGYRHDGLPAGGGERLTRADAPLVLWRAWVSCSERCTPARSRATISSPRSGSARRSRRLGRRPPLGPVPVRTLASRAPSRRRPRLRRHRSSPVSRVWPARTVTRAPRIAVCRASVRPVKTCRAALAPGAPTEAARPRNVATVVWARARSTSTAAGPA